MDCRTCQEEGRMKIVSAFVSNLGLQLQKKAHVENENLVKRERIPYTQQKNWWIGFVLVVLGSFGDFAALSFAAQSLVAVVGGGVTVIANVLLSKEKFNTKHGIGTLFVALGILIASQYSPRDDHYSLQQIMAHFESSLVSMYFLFIAAVVSVFVFLSTDRNARTDTIQPYYYAITSGIVGSVSMLLAKLISELLSTSLSGENQFVYGMTYYFILGLLGCIYLQTVWLNKALVAGDISTIVPTFQVFWIGFSVIGGTIFYNDLSDLDPVAALCFLMACCLILTGVYCLSEPQAIKQTVAAPLKLRKSEATESLLQENDDEFVEIPIDVEPYRPPALLHSL